MSRFLIEKDGERQNVTSMAGYEDWTVISEIADEVPDHEAELVEGQWVVPVGVRRDRMWAQVKAIRDEKEGGDATTTFGVVQCDDRSKIKINGLAQMAQLAKAMGSPFSVEFAMADNSLVTLDSDGAMSLGIQTGQYISALYTRARALRDEIYASDDPESIDINVGWPG